MKAGVEILSWTTNTEGYESGYMNHSLLRRSISEPDTRITHSELSFLRISFSNLYIHEKKRNAYLAGTVLT